MKEYLAVDIGASSGRHILGRYEDGKLVLEEIYRFDNGYVKKDGHSCWDIDSLCAEVIKGIAACGKKGRIPALIGIDTWAVDFVLLDSSGKRIGDAVAYRDKRTADMDKLVEKEISFSELYSRTGIQKQVFNTIYQLTALKNEAPEQLERAERLLLIPDYLNYCLTGKMTNEYTNASSTALVDAADKSWDFELIERLGFKKPIFGKISMPGTVIGGFTEEVKAKVGFDSQVVLPATHDTGSAFLAVPARDDNAVYISSGTWSLLGIENMKPITTKAGMEANFTNEGGYQGRYRYLKNIMGLWMIQSIRRNYDKKYSFAQLEDFARENSDFESLVNVNDGRFLAPESMIEEIQQACRESGQRIPEKPGEIMQCVYGSLAEGYRESIKELEALSGKSFTSINIVGGGSKDSYLNSLTAKAAGIPVYAGPTEGTALGNLMVQMITDGVFADLQEARSAIKKSFEIKKYNP